MSIAIPKNYDSIIQANITGALDFQEFIAKTKELGIDLKFEEQPGINGL